MDFKVVIAFIILAALVIVPIAFAIAVGAGLDVLIFFGTFATLGAVLWAIITIMDWSYNKK